MHYLETIFLYVDLKVERIGMY